MPLILPSFSLLAILGAAEACKVGLIARLAYRVSLILSAAAAQGNHVMCIAEISNPRYAMIAGDLPLHGAPALP